ncbi:type II toxin-antitoxin system PemK/MazF family toxin [Romeria aff. gracilis LEGE 07310]|uniref:Type II toxin-antitoxin system PemK/MazF family toxin n=1 Tax=Vasconcelosia minhoensis LEGE 07310 TaxID=915328 RepID=A0A8J7AJN2_9CYAN|nr:type II toxin-antitoxin system PemK/MazF family toxin [Romeria gracilis]MBE9075849.1 type II toxin-antitoxin system PemK/MazF family toxin [Romeria aff. gracilis LEGE 07310]
METYLSGEVVLIAFPFTDSVRQKQRPALVLLDVEDPDIVVARITSQLYSTSFDVSLLDSTQAGLLLPSVVRLHKIATLEKRIVNRRLGQLSTRDWANVSTALRAIFLR